MSDEASDQAEVKTNKPGIVYISRLPPGMKPGQLKTILGNYARVDRVWATTNTTSGRKKTRAPAEAWVEFHARKKAKRIAESLNCTPMGIGRFKEDLWMIKYLKGFQWSDLMNQQLHHKKLRDQRLRQHVDFAKRQANFYLDNVEKQQEYEKRQDKKRKREDDDKGSDEESPAPAPAPAPAPVKLNENTIKRTFQQRDVTANKEDEDELDDGFFAQLLGGPTAMPKAKRPKAEN